MYPESKENLQVIFYSAAPSKKKKKGPIIPNENVVAQTIMPGKFTSFSTVTLWFFSVQ